MSAIFGIWRLDGRPVDPAHLRRMSERLAHRGEDGAGLWCEGSVGIGHRLRHTTPESLREGQPVVRLGSGLVLSADARIDNRDELRAALGLPAAHHPGLTDAELVLAAYERWGRAGVARLIGDYAFCVWDPRRRTLLAARDPMGVKPLFYHRSHRLVAFASEIKALLCLPDVPQRLDELQVACYLEQRLDDAAATVYHGIRRLPAAHWMEVGADGRADLARYWRLDAERELTLRDDGEYVEAFRERFIEAVRCRVRSAFPVASTLSGGLDSSSIACVARDILAARGQRLHTLSAVFPGLPPAERALADERPYIEAVLGTGAFVSHLVRADTVGPFHDVERVLAHMDEPPLAYSLYMHWRLYEVARSHDVRVVLDGVDGDACIGYGTAGLVDLLRAERWDLFASEVRALSTRLAPAVHVPVERVLRQAAYPHLHELARAYALGRWHRAARALSARFDVPMRRLARQHALRPLIPGRLLALRRGRRGHRAATAAPGLLRPEFRRRVGLDECLRAWDARDPVGVPTGRQAHRRMLESPAYQYTMGVADRAGCAFGLESRFPFFDRRLMELCIALPQSQRLRDGWMRWILRPSMEGILPPEVQWRPWKQDLAPNFRRGLRERDGTVVAALHAPRPHPLEPYVDLAALRALEARVRATSGSGGAGGDDADGLLLYRATMLAAWLRSSAADGARPPAH